MRIIVCAVASLGLIACGNAFTTESVDTKSTAAKAQPMDAICSSAPWTSEGRFCGNPELVHGRTLTCEDLGLTGNGETITVTELTNNGGYLSASFSTIPGYTTTVYTNTNNPRPELNHWGITSTVQPDASTVTVDAILLTGGRGDGTLIFRFDPAEFYVRNMAELFPATTIQLCNYRLGQASGPPPG